MTFVASHIIPCVCSLFVTTLSPEERHEYLNFDLHFTFHSTFWRQTLNFSICYIYVTFHCRLDQQLSYLFIRRIQTRRKNTDFENMNIGYDWEQCCSPITSLGDALRRGTITADSCAVTLHIGPGLRFEEEIPEQILQGGAQDRKKDTLLAGRRCAFSMMLNGDQVLPPIACL